MNTLTNSSKRLLSYSTIAQTNPMQQMMWVLLVAIISILLFGTFSSNEEIEWFIACASLGFFVWMNVILGFFKKEGWIMYVLQSAILFIFLFLVLYFLADFISNVPAYREYHIMLLATTVFYVLSTLLSALFKNVASLMGIEY